MTAIAWDQPGERFYESGVDRGVLYLQSGFGVAWNGLVSVSDKPTGTVVNPVYFDGVKFADVATPGDYAGVISAYTYPDEFLEFEGTSEVGNGLFVTSQQPGKFGLSYRTRIGNDESDDEHYKLHLLYNLTAVASAKNFQSLSESPNAVVFEWNITGIPGEIPGYRPSAHVIFDTRLMDDLLIADIESTLYGNELNPPTLPDISTLSSFVGSWVIIRITEFPDGTWTAEGPDSMITMLDATTFQIINANVVYLDADTYVITDTTH